jgi:CRP-like cAMP-binding protein
MIEAHLLKLRRRDDVSPAEEAIIRSLIGEVRKVPADKVVIRAGEELHESLLLVDGWLARARDLAEGQRQITELHLPGDFADLHSFTLKRLEHNVISLTPCTIAAVPHERLLRVSEEQPHLTRLFWFSTNLDAAIHREWAVSLGRRPALARIAHLFCELFERLQIVGHVSGNSYAFPLTQAELAECLGLTAVHINRTLQELRARKLLAFENRQVTLLDTDQLKEVAEFDPAYLYLERRPR